MDEDLKFDIVCLNSELFDSEPHISCRVLYFDCIYALKKCIALN